MYPRNRIYLWILTFFSSSSSFYSIICILYMYVWPFFWVCLNAKLSQRCESLLLFFLCVWCCHLRDLLIMCHMRMNRWQLFWAYSREKEMTRIACEKNVHDWLQLDNLILCHLYWVSAVAMLLACCCHHIIWAVVLQCHQNVMNDSALI